MASEGTQERTSGPDTTDRGTDGSAASAAADAARPASGESVRVDSWIWSVRLVKTRSMGATACRGGHVRVNGERVKPAHALRVGDEVRLRQAGGHERIVVVRRLIRKRVGAPVAAECYVDNSPPPHLGSRGHPANAGEHGEHTPHRRRTLPWVSPRGFPEVTGKLLGDTRRAGGAATVTPLVAPIAPTASGLPRPGVAPRRSGRAERSG
ncbi:RNA-binding S4 domain-containing protein [Streptomyces europaeiscabiei]|uniref:RNA-binding S4 domain-containing protein n=1 Tax=Streptomyces europaeiscabiei TaxID=146819 RepID=UPI0029BA3C29|nr:RNA-binding S4 domain-containing protein [Streptomyces europaeiscabiei]MDX3619199.1 RNA-binding S4 domain-containing protein [Streptomyces europaeiscabiei]